MTFFCGFEAIDASEYTTGTAVTLQAGGPMADAGGYCASLGASTGAISWTLSETNIQTAVASCNFYLTPGVTDGIPLKVVRGGYNFYVEVEPDTNPAQTKFTFHANALSGIAVTGASSGWTNVVIIIRGGAAMLYVNGNYLLYLAFGSTGNITQISASNASASATLMVDDYVLYFSDTYNPKSTAYVYPWVPKEYGDRGVELYGYPVGGNNSSKVDDTTSDSDATYVYTPGDGTHEDLYECQAFLSTLPYELVSVTGFKTHLTARYSTSGSVATAYTGFQIGAAGTPVYFSQALTASYATYHKYLIKSWEPRYFTNSTDPVVMLALKCTVTGAVIRVTKYRASLLVFCTPKAIPTDVHLTGGMDLYFDIDATAWPDAYHWLMINTNVYARPIGIYWAPMPLQIAIVKQQWLTEYKYYVQVGAGAATTPAEMTYSEKQYIGISDNIGLRIVIHNENVSIFNNGNWIHTFTFPAMDYPDSWEIELEASYATEIENICLVELCDSREAIYIDMATPTGGGLEAIIQERPVETNPISSGGIDFSYNRVRPEVVLGNIYSHKITEAVVSGAGSHYIVYYAKVAIVEDETFMDSYGYLTKVLQLSNLDAGAIDVGNIMALRAQEQQERHVITCAPDIRVEPGDLVSFSYVLSGTGRSVSGTIIAETVQLSIADGQYSMTIEGRKYVS